jgi:hypothetical protein
MVSEEKFRELQEELEGAIEDFILSWPPGQELPSIGELEELATKEGPWKEKAQAVLRPFLEFGTLWAQEMRARVREELALLIREKFTTLIRVVTELLPQPPAPNTPLGALLCVVEGKDAKALEEALDWLATEWFPWDKVYYYAHWRGPLEKGFTERVKSEGKSPQEVWAKIVGSYIWEACSGKAFLDVPVLKAREYLLDWLRKNKREIEKEILGKTLRELKRETPFSIAKVPEEALYSQTQVTEGKEGIWEALRALGVSEEELENLTDKDWESLLAIRDKDKIEKLAEKRGVTPDAVYQQQHRLIERLRQASGRTKA